LIDLHLHTTASDGVFAPAALVARALHAGITTLSVTDHDTTAGLAGARAAARAGGARFIDGIEITCVERGRDVHMLGYFFDPASERLARFLDRQRADRRRRLVEMAERLKALGFRIDADAILGRAASAPHRSVGRPLLADALVAAGHVATRHEAFDLWLGEGRPAFVPRRGAPPAEVIQIIHDAGGIAALAHPGLLDMDDILSGLRAGGLDAVEAVHCDHDAATEKHYRDLSAAHGLAVSGGSDFHGDGGHCGLGEICLPNPDFDLLEMRARNPQPKN
jgi:predicted metal-dependent phosphoesterase TrpH